MPGTSRSRSQIPDAARRKHEKFQTEQEHRRTLRHRTVYAVTGLVVIAAAVLTTALWPRHHGPTPPTPASQVDTYHRACILTDPGDPDLPTAQAGLHQAGTTTGDIDVQNYPLPTATTNAAPYLASLISNKCTVILTLGDQPDIAVDAYAQNNPNTTLKFVTIAGPSTTSRAITVLPATDLTASSIATLVENDFS